MMLQMVSNIGQRKLINRYFSFRISIIHYANLVVYLRGIDVLSVTHEPKYSSKDTIIRLSRNLNTILCKYRNPIVPCFDIY